MRMSDFLARRMMSARQGATPIETIGRFSVSASKVVGFSRGNLQAEIDANGNPVLWKFAEHQYDYIGNAVANTSIGTTAGTIDLFGWSTDGVGASAGYKEWGINTSGDNMDYQGDFKDWGSNPSLIDLLGVNWATLSKYEWAYLINTRTGNRFAKAKINNVNGLIIFPDSYSGTTSGDGIAEVNSINVEYPISSIPTDSWLPMELLGCVFLPISGYRQGSKIYDIPVGGAYWSSNAYYSNYATYLSFHRNRISTDYNGVRFNGMGVRLAKELN